MSTFYIVSTPIGNLGDVTFRAIEILKGVDLILCEDTRQTLKLLNHYGISKPLVSYFQHSKLAKIDYILEQLKQGKNIALVSDAGTPGISDPGNKLVSLIAEKAEKTEIIPIPGPSALTAAASISGFPTDKFLFLGFPPAKRKRKKFFEEIAGSKYPVIFYESPHRILKSLRDLYGFTQIGNQINTDRKIVVCRELTKKFETIYRGKVEQIIKELEGDEPDDSSSPSPLLRKGSVSDKNNLRGEFVVIVKNE